jgi:hypothetical protein
VKPAIRILVEKEEEDGVSSSLPTLTVVVLAAERKQEIWFWKP